MINLSKPTLVLLTIMLMSIAAQAQYYYYNSNYYDRNIVWEVGVSGGYMNGMTDVGGSKGFMPNSGAGQPNGSFYVGAMFQNLAGLRLEATWGSIAGADSNGVQKNRNLSFKTPIREVALIGEFHPLMLKYYDELPPYSPYIAFGMGWFSFNPQANLNGNWVDLQPLRTEGQGFPQRPGTRPYSLSGSALIGGIGLKYELSHLLTARVELLARKTFTDYLDDASTSYVDPAWFDANLPPARAALAKQLYDRSIIKDPNYTGVNAMRSNSRSKDQYMSLNIKLAINLGRSRIN